MKTVYGDNFYIQKLMGSQKHSLNLIGLGRGQRPPVFFYTTYRFKNNIYLENQKILYTVFTLVLT